MSKIARLLDIREQEIVPCFMFSVLNFLIMAGIFIGRAAKDSLFFIEVGAEWLPVAFVINAVVLIGVSLLFSKISGRYARNKQKLLYTNFLIFAVVIIVFGVLLNARIDSQYYHVIYWVFFVFCEITLFVMMRLFWFFTEDYFTEQQMKRLSPKFVGSGQIGIGMGGILTLVLVGFIGTANIIFIWVALVLVAIYISMRILKSIKTLPATEEDLEDVEETETGSIFDGVKIVRKSRYLMLFVAITICAFFAATIFDVALASTAEDYFEGDADRLTYFLGMITIVFGFAAAAVQFLFMSKIIRRLGVGGANLFAPILLVVGSVVLILSFTFEGAAISRILFLGNEYLFNQTIIVLIYNAVREDKRSKASFFIEGAVVSSAIGVAGAGLLIYSKVLPLDKLGWVALIFGLVMLACSLLLKDEYKKILIDNLGARPPEDRNLMLKNALGLNDEASENVVYASIRSPDETTAIVAMDMVMNVRKDEPDENKKREYLNIALERVGDANRNIRLAAIAMITALSRDEEFKDKYFRSITDTLIRRDPAGNAELVYGDRETINAIMSLYTAWDEGITGDLESLMTCLKANDDREIVGDLILHLKTMGFMGIYRAIELLNELMESEDDTDRKVSNRVLGVMGEEAFHRDLVQFCRINKEKQADPEQTREIIKAFGKIDYKNDGKASEAFGLLIDCLSEPLLMKDASRSLERLLERKPFLFGKFRELYMDGRLGLEMKREIPGIVRRVRLGVVV